MGFKQSRNEVFRGEVRLGWFGHVCTLLTDLFGVNLLNTALKVMS